MKLLGTFVRLADGREGHVAGSTIDGYTIVVDGRIVTALPKDVTAIPAPYSPPIPEPVRTAQRPIKTSHEEPPNPFPSRPHNLSVLASGKWSDPQ
jgi:hypothetical protein